MSKTIDKLCEEHRNLEKLLTVLKYQIDSYAKGGAADLELVSDILDYHRHFPDACHHPKEDVILDILKNVIRKPRVPLGTWIKSTREFVCTVIDYLWLWKTS